MTGPAALPTGWVPRPARLTDVDALYRLSTLLGDALGRPPVASLEDLRSDLAFPDLDAERDTLVIDDPASDVPFLYVIAYTDRPGRLFVDPYVRPDLDDATIAVALDHALAFGTARAFTFGEQTAAPTMTLDAAAMQGEQRMFDAFVRAGMQHARRYWRMRMALPPAAELQAPSLIPGLVTTRVDLDTDTDVERVHRLIDITFADHYAHVPIPIDAFTTELRHGSGYVRDAAWIVTETGTGQDVAVMTCDDSRAEDDLWWVDHLGVMASHRGRGIARSLLRTAMADAVARGRAHLGLDVDTDNVTPALALYESVGLRADAVIDSYELLLTLTD
jgi:ribosomal protein S18 acetylase RimI-like enzyme